MEEIIQAIKDFKNALAFSVKKKDFLNKIDYIK